MKVVIIADVMDTGLGGMRTYAENLVRCLPYADSENQFYIINLNRSHAIHNVRFIKIPFTKYVGKFFIRKFYHVPKKIRAINPDLVLETTHFGPFFLPRRIKRVTVIHDLSTFIHPEHYTWINVMAERLFLPRIIRRADHLITVSESTKTDIKKLFTIADSKVSVVPLGKESLFKKTEDSRVLGKYKIEKQFLLHVGTIQPRKNLTVLLSAFGKLRSSRSDVQLILVGEIGWKSAGLLNQIKSHQYATDILLLGHIPKADLPGLYSKCLAFIYPTLYEGFGLPLLEAMACGAPCIASNVSSVPEVGGRAPLYFAPHELDTLTDMLFDIYDQESLRHRLGETSERQSLGFEWSSTTKKSVDILRNLVTDKSI